MQTSAGQAQGWPEYTFELTIVVTDDVLVVLLLELLLLALTLGVLGESLLGLALLGVALRVVDSLGVGVVADLLGATLDLGVGGLQGQNI
jgi:hypothetical protein